MADSTGKAGMEKELQALLDDLDFQNFILGDQQKSAPDDHEAIAETSGNIKRIQAEIDKLLGKVAPVSPPHHPPVPATPQPSVQRPQHPIKTPPLLTSDPSYMSPQAPNRIGDPSSIPGSYWPSSAPSPFTTEQTGRVVPRDINGLWARSHPLRPGQFGYSGPSSSRDPPSGPAFGSRKRARGDSFGSLYPAQPTKKTTINNSQSRLDELEAKLTQQLEENRQSYAIMKDPEEVRKAARLEGVSEEQFLLDINQEEEENAKCIQTFIQAEKDEAYARMLQAQDDEYAGSYPSAPPRFNIPDRTHYPPSVNAPAVKMEPYSNPRMDYRSPNPVLVDSDDDIEEITPDTFFASERGPINLSSNNSPINGGIYPSQRVLPMPGGFPVMPSRMAMYNPHHDWKPMNLGFNGLPLPYPSQLLGSSSPARPLPWMQASLPERKAFDLVREQQDLEEDAIDFEAYKESDFPDDIKNLLTGIKNINDATKANNDEKPQALKVTLMKHQGIGLSWLKAKEESLHKGGILADDMGLGKTIQTIALMVARPPTDPERHPSLIVAPKALMEQWRLEIGRHVNHGKHQLSVFIYHSLGGRQMPWREIKKYDVVITTFGTLTANFKYVLQSEKLQEEKKDASIVRAVRDKAVLFSAAAKWHRVIIDEAQNIKNPAAKSAKACCRLDASYRWCLTGTPMMNRLEDFQSLLSFLRIRPYNNKEKFKRDFVKPIKAGWCDDQRMKQLRVLVKSVCLRRTKKTKIDGQPILQLPPKVIEKIHVVFDEEAKAVYDALSSDTQRVITRYLDNGTLGKNYSHVLVLLLRLRQACCHPLLIRGFNSDGSASVQGVDLVANAKLLSAATVERIKNNTEEDDGACPICMDSVENAVIYIPCGHSLCSECFARISDPVQMARQDSDAPSGMIKCQNCRGPVDPLKVTDATSFKKAFDPAATSGEGSAEGSDGSAEQTEDSDSVDSDSDSDSETETDGFDEKPKKKSLADLRIAAQKNKAEKRKYLSRLEKMWTPSAKITKTMEILDANENRGAGEKTIVFSQFTSLLDLLEIPMRRRGWAYVRFDGSMNVHDRNASVAAFTDDPECKVMLVSLKAGNAGLNLIAASHVIIFDPFWNPYVEDQAIDRAHRIGQTKDVFVHRLLIEGTVEDRIVELQEQKRELIGGALDEGGTMNVAGLNTRDLAFLFGVRV